jgi:DnaJ-class molecular chaperone
LKKEIIMNAKCDQCGFEGEIDMWGCPRCKGMGNYFWMEGVRDLTVDVNQLIENRLKEFNITLTDEQEDEIHNAVWKVLEDVSNGYYKNHN